MVAAGGLASYGPDSIEQYRRAAGYIDRILKGEKPADLRVQSPTKYETAINLRTAKALGLEVPVAFLARPRRRGGDRIEGGAFITPLVARRASGLTCRHRFIRNVLLCFADAHAT
jgi:hypothetical protein